MRRPLKFLTLFCVVAWTTYFAYTLLAVYHLRGCMPQQQLLRLVLVPILMIALALWLGRQRSLPSRVSMAIQAALLIVGCYYSYWGWKGPDPRL